MTYSAPIREIRPTSWGPTPEEVEAASWWLAGACRHADRVSTQQLPSISAAARVARAAAQARHRAIEAACITLRTAYEIVQVGLALASVIGLVVFLYFITQVHI